MPDHCIKIENLTKRYAGEKIDSLGGIDLTIEAGNKFGILGPNGAGKTTLISILCGIFEQSSGNVFYWNKPFNPKRDKHKMGYVPQEYAFYTELTPLQNLEYFAAMHNMKAAEIKRESHHKLEILGLDNVKNKKLSTFSGGMKRRLNLAIGIIHQPSILFLDEPTVGVDVQSKAAIINLLNQLNKDGTTIVYTSHHLEEAQEFCSHIALIDYGKIIASGETKSLLNTHQVDDLKALLIKLTGEAFRD